MKASRTIWTANGGTVNGISNGGYTTIVDLAVTTTGLQSLLVTTTLRCQNASGANRNVGLRVVDITAGGSPTAGRSVVVTIAPSGGADTVPVSATFLYTTPAGGARTLRLSAGTDGASVN